MKSKHEIPSKTDYMKAYTYNLILTERTNCELEHERNIGKIDAAFYRNFSWQIMGKQRERQLSQTETKDDAKSIKQNLLSQANGRPRRQSFHGTHQDQDQGKVKAVVESRTDFNGNVPKRYTSTCYFKTNNIPAWYSESVLIKIGSTKRVYDEKVWFKHKIQPYYWEENMTTEVNFAPTIQQTSQIRIPVVAPDDDHYISLEPQQTAAGAS
ncbi:unnamed protein product [Ceutorhynchus assimilis]|uniref:Uncharacterized protein n=1 Tax=Ceutorhynchus assimilis TaxID=467358 RepID=A0A9N9MBM2_9CUCU|nr:unnamed protein product [Ceutorhynchus assimilis]